VARRSAGLLMYRMRPVGPEVLLVHPGGPFWAKKDDGVWSIPKGLYEDENALAAAKREFEEETGCKPQGDFIALGSFTQSGGKVVAAWAFEGDFDLKSFRSNLFAMEWPPRSGRTAQFPEADRAGWFTPTEALRKIVKGQMPIVNALLTKLGASGASSVHPQAGKTAPKKGRGSPA
jgi:predicted NUDIX family NTP pyrophosphohydrolase